jgi:hypothetical protein
MSTTLPAASIQRTIERAGPEGICHWVRVMRAASAGSVVKGSKPGMVRLAARATSSRRKSECMRTMFSCASNCRHTVGLAVARRRMCASTASAAVGLLARSRNRTVTPRAAAIRSMVSASGSRRSFS